MIKMRLHCQVVMKGYLIGLLSLGENSFPHAEILPCWSSRLRWSQSVRLLLRRRTDSPAPSRHVTYIKARSARPSAHPIRSVSINAPSAISLAASL
jgi:hypothetical protein